MRSFDASELPDLRTDFDGFYAWSLPRVYRFALAAAGETATAEDLTSEAFMEMLDHYDDLPEHPLAILGWLRTTVRNKSVDLVRQRVVRSQALALIAVKDCESPSGRDLDSDPLVQAERRGIVFDVLAGLSDHHREALQWRYLDGRSIAQVSELCQMSYPATASLLYRAREAFREAMKRAECSSGPAKIEIDFKGDH